MPRRRRVVLTGVGAITPVGDNVESTWKAMVEGRTGVARLTSFESPFNSQIAAEIKDFDGTPYMTTKQIRRLDIFVQYAIAAAKMAVTDSGIDMEKIDEEKAGVYIGSGIGGLHTIEAEHTKYMLTEDENVAAARLSPFLIPMLIVNMASGMVSVELG
ncbi:MAG: beta-ketoacyl-[acyl-carrier-protein] synthase II, partial [Candidatus Omnitrophica bacterium]|nr:beta-ketoacyl-[acyl-carrier-protein] synthase II [Candidatus Omnitrophota bacterium]